MDTKRKILIGVGVLGVGAYALTQKGEDTPAGKVGSILSAPIESFTGAPDVGVEPKTPSERIGEIFEMMPPLPGIGGDGLPGAGFRMPTEPAAKKKPLIPSWVGGGVSAIGKGIGATAIIGTQAGAFTVMKPVQVLGGTAAKVADRLITYPMAPSTAKKYRRQQAARVTRYPRAAHAVSMVTGGVTARPAPTKKQVAARKKYPRTYKAWKTAFSWLGA